MKTIAFLAPSRGRPEWMLRFADSLLATTAKPERVELLIYVDDNDPKRYEYQYRMQARSQDLRAFRKMPLFITEPIGLPRSTNLLAFQTDAEVLIMASDDIVMRTKNWDLRMDEEAQKYPDGIYCMWFDDGHYREKLCTFPIVSRRWADTLGYLYPPMFERLYCDQYVMDVARRLGRLNYIPDVLMEHLHWSYGKSEIDETFAVQVDPTGKLKPVVWRDKRIFELTTHLRDADARKLGAIWKLPVVAQ